MPSSFWRTTQAWRRPIPSSRPPTTHSILPRAVHFVGALAVHDMLLTDGGLIGVNTLFSCLFRLDPAHSFRPIWKPPFISSLTPEERCHLNGSTAVDGIPRYATALGLTDDAGGWRQKRERGGVVMDLSSGEPILTGLAMPHSPRVYDGKRYALLSATGELVAIDAERGAYDVVTNVGGFARGMARRGDYLFVGSSKLRRQHTFGDLRWAGKKDAVCGISVIHLPSGAFVGEITYLRSCEEIYDVQVLPEMKRPGVLGVSDDVHLEALSLPDKTFWAKERE